MMRDEIQIGDIVAYRYHTEWLIGLVVYKAPYGNIFDIEWAKDGEIGRYDEEILIGWKENIKYIE